MNQPTIWKYRLEDSGETNITMPSGSEVLSVGAQGTDLVLWARVTVSPFGVTVDRQFWTALTGAALPPHLGRFIGTVQRDWFVTHVWEMAE